MIYNLQLANAERKKKEEKITIYSIFFSKYKLNKKKKKKQKLF